VTADQFDLAMGIVFRLAQYLACGFLVVALLHALGEAKARPLGMGPITVGGLLGRACLVALWPGTLIFWWVMYGWELLEIERRDQ
jgi:hypothetical protein